MKSSPLLTFRLMIAVLFVSGFAAEGEGLDPHVAQLIVFVQLGTSAVADRFSADNLPAIRKLAAEMKLPLRVVNVKKGAPKEITITPLIVYQNFRGRAIFQGRYTDLNRIKTFIRTSRAVAQGTQTLHKTGIPVRRIDRAVIAAPLKIAPVAGSRPDQYDGDSFIQNARQSVLKGFTDFRWTDSIELRRSDRRFYMDFYPWRSDDGTLFLTTSLYSQFHCKKPVFTTEGKPLTGPWAQRDRLFRQAAERLERAVGEQLAGPSTGDGFDAVAANTTVVTWDSLGLALPPPPTKRENVARDIKDLPRYWVVDGEHDTDVPQIQFRFPAPLDMYAGEIKKVAGRFVLGKGLSLATARGSFDADPTSITMGEPDLDDALRSSVFLHVSKYPASRFTIESVSVDDGAIAFGTVTLATLQGTFELKGMRGALSVRSTFEPVVGENGGPQLLMNGSFSIDLRKFSIEGADGPAPANHTLLFDVHFVMTPARGD